MQRLCADQSGGGGYLVVHSREKLRLSSRKARHQPSFSVTQSIRKTSEEEAG